jgi:hypothetical protein
MMNERMKLSPDEPDRLVLSDWTETAACCALLGTQHPPLADEAYIQVSTRQTRAKSRQITFLHLFSDSDSKLVS